MTDFPKLQKRYDHVIIGYNLASMTFASELAKRGAQFAIIDAKHLGSSPIKNISSLGRNIATRVAFNPDFERSDDEAPIWGEVDLLEGPPTTFDKGQFRSFLGFGDKKISSLEAVQVFCSSKRFRPQLKVEHQWERVLQDTEQHLFLDQQVTGIHHEDSRITKLDLNGKSSISADHFYFFDHFQFLYEQLGQELKKAASQFAKAKWHSSVNLVIHHTERPEALELDDVYLLMGSKEQPCIGQFLEIDGQLVSRWESFFASELSLDAEMTGAMVKEIKKQIKRAFTFPESNKDHEHILIHDRVFADFEKSSIESGPIGHFENLYGISPLFSGHYGWVQEVRSGKFTISQTFSEEPTASITELSDSDDLDESL